MREKPKGCECCGHKTESLTFYEAENWYKHKTEWLCVVCANTHLQGLKANPLFEKQDVEDVMHHITLCANLILDEIKAQRAERNSMHKSVPENPAT